MSNQNERFLDYSAEKLRQYVGRILDCLRRLEPDQVWARGGDHENSIGNIVLHLCGNVNQWMGHGVAGRPNTRQRDAEFEARGGVELSELAERIRLTVNDAIEIILAQSDATLLEVTEVQDYRLTKFEAIYHVVEHFSGHTGQIMFATKLLTGQDLGYYKHLSKSASIQEKIDPIP